MFKKNKVEYENLHGWRITYTYIGAHLTYLEDPLQGWRWRAGYLGTLVLQRHPQGNSNIQLSRFLSFPILDEKLVINLS